MTREGDKAEGHTAFYPSSPLALANLPVLRLLPVITEVSMYSFSLQNEEQKPSSVASQEASRAVVVRRLLVTGETDCSLQRKSGVRGRV